MIVASGFKETPPRAVEPTQPTTARYCLRHNENSGRCPEEGQEKFQLFSIPLEIQMICTEV